MADDDSTHDSDEADFDESDDGLRTDAGDPVPDDQHSRSACNTVTADVTAGGAR